MHSQSAHICPDHWLSVGRSPAGAVEGQTISRAKRWAEVGSCRVRGGHARRGIVPRVIYGRGATGHLCLHQCGRTQGIMCTQEQAKQKLAMLCRWICCGLCLCLCLLLLALIVLAVELAEFGGCVGQCGAHGSCVDFGAPSCVDDPFLPGPHSCADYSLDNWDTSAPRRAGYSCSSSPSPLSNNTVADHCPTACEKRSRATGCCACESGWYGPRCEFKADDVLPCAHCGLHGLCVGGNTPNCADDVVDDPLLRSSGNSQVNFYIRGTHHGAGEEPGGVCIVKGWAADESWVDPSPTVVGGTHHGGYCAQGSRRTPFTCSAVARGGGLGREHCDDRCIFDTRGTPTVVTPGDLCPVTCGRTAGCCTCEAGWYGARCERNEVVGRCADIKDWAGVLCDSVLCPGGCGSGECDNRTKTCTCPTGRVGLTCDQYEADAFVREEATSLCPTGTDIDRTSSEGTTFESLERLLAACTPCPFPDNCNGTQNCTSHSSGNLCSECEQGYYSDYIAASASRACVKCAHAIDTQWVRVLWFIIAVVAASAVVWKVSKQEPYKPPAATAAAKATAKATAKTVSAAKKAWGGSHQGATGSATKTTVQHTATTTAMARSADRLAISIVWPHFAFSMLPLTLPHVSWPRVVTDVADMFRSLAFLDVASLVAPECVVATTDSAHKALLSLGVSQGGFWCVHLVFSLVHFATGTITKRQDLSQRAVNAQVFVFFMAHALLLKSSLGALDCVGDFDVGNSLSNGTAWVGYIRSSPATACDARATVAGVLFALFAACGQIGDRVTRYIKRQVKEEQGLSTWQVNCHCCYPKSEVNFTARFDALVEEAELQPVVISKVLPCVKLGICKILPWDQISEGLPGMSGATVCGSLGGFLGALVLLVYMVVARADAVSAPAYWLSFAGTCGLAMYGIWVPTTYLHELQWNIEGVDRLHEPDFRERYGYLISRFKPGKWISEFRILGRKTALLFIAAIFAERPGIAIPAQVATLTWALWRHIREHPFAEVGSRKAAFEDNNPEGWSRGDVLELMTLLSQIGLNVVAFFLINDAPNGEEHRASTLQSTAVALAAFVSTVSPTLYATHMVITEYLAERDRKRQEAASADMGEGLIAPERVINPTR